MGNKSKRKTSESPDATSQSKDNTSSNEDYNSNHEDAYQERDRGHTRQANLRAPEVAGPQHTENSIRHRRSAPYRASVAATEQDGRYFHDGEAMPVDSGVTLSQKIVAYVWEPLRKLWTTSLVSYTFWKWLVVTYLMWLALSYSVVGLCGGPDVTLSKVCNAPAVGPHLRVCQVSLDSKRGSVDISKIAESQKELVVVVDYIGQNYDLAGGMAGNEIAIRDLKHRVAASNFPLRREWTRELESLLRYTKETARALSRYTTRVRMSIDTVTLIDKYAAQTVEEFATSQQNGPNLLVRSVSAFAPLGAFYVVSPTYKDDQVKDFLTSTAARISQRVRMLLEDSLKLEHGLSSIQNTLDRIERLAVNGIGNRPRTNILSELWDEVALPEDQERLKENAALLRNMTSFYERSSYIMNGITAALVRMMEELGEVRNAIATPGLSLKTHSLDITVALLRKFAKRLEAGRSEIRSVKAGDTPQVSVVTREATIIRS